VVDSKSVEFCGWVDECFQRRLRKNRKGCDIGYALAASSCEGANRVDACTVTALDAITAFAVPNPNCSSQIQSVFSGLAARPSCPSRANHSVYFGLATIYFRQPFRPSTGATLTVPQSMSTPAFGAMAAIPTGKSTGCNVLRNLVFVIYRSFCARFSTTVAHSCP